MNADTFLLREGWEKNGNNFYYPKGGYPHIHLGLKHRNSAHKSYLNHDVGSGAGYSGVKAAYASLRPWIDFVTISRGPDYGGGTNFISDGAKTGHAYRVEETLLAEFPKYPDTDSATEDLSNIRNKLAYILAAYGLTISR